MGYAKNILIWLGRNWWVNYRYGNTEVNIDE